jgi:hypothetical protein
MGDLLLHPTHWLFVQLKHPGCKGGCGEEIFPMTPVEIEELPNGQMMFWHKECWEKAHEPDEPEPLQTE